MRESDSELISIKISQSLVGACVIIYRKKEILTNLRGIGFNNYVSYFPPHSSSAKLQNFRHQICLGWSTTYRFRVRLGTFLKSRFFLVLTSDVEAVIAGELGERRHVVWVVGELVRLLRYTTCCLLDAVVICVLSLKIDSNGIVNWDESAGSYRDMKFYIQHMPDRQLFVCLCVFCIREWEVRALPWASWAPAGSCSLACCRKDRLWQWGWCHQAGRQTKTCLPFQDWERERHTQQ